MSITKGKWEVIRPYIDEPITIETRIRGNLWDKIATISMMNPKNQLENANLIVTAVNACQSVNSDNPLSVAESIKDMYEALKALWKAIKFHHLDEDSKFGVLYKNQVEQALAKVEGK